MRVLRLVLLPMILQHYLFKLNRLIDSYQNRSKEGIFLCGILMRAWLAIPCLQMDIPALSSRYNSFSFLFRIDTGPMPLMRNYCYGFFLLAFFVIYSLGS